MADLKIPGVTESKYQTEKLINGLMEVKEKKLDSLNLQQQNFEQRRQVWRNLNILTQQLETAAAKLYALDNPFKSRQVISSDSQLLQAEAQRGAQIGSYDFQVESLAKVHSIESSKLAATTEIAAGVYPLKLGNEEVNINFAGGTVKEFVTAVNEQQDLLLAESITPAADKIVVKLTGAESGNGQRIYFPGESSQLAKTLGFTREAKSLDILTTEDNQEGRLNIAAKEQKRIELEPTFSLFPGARLNYRYTQKNLIQTIDKQILRQSYGLYLAPTVYQNLTIEQLSSDEALRRIVLPNLAENHRTSSRGGVSLLDVEGNVLKLTEFDEQQEKQSSLQLEQLSNNKIRSVLINNDSEQDMQFLQLSIDYPNTANQNGLQYAQQIQEPSNARIKYNGTELERSSNTFNDLIPGVNIELKEAQPGQNIELNVVSDYDSIAEEIINFVKNYNNLLTEINILATRNTAIIDEKINFNEEQRRDAAERLGLLQGNTDIMRLANSLRSMSSTNFLTSEGEKSLSAIGISTNVEASSGQIDKRKLRGYLEIDTGVLAQVLEENWQLAKDIFGFDANQDGVVDSGLAYQVRQISYKYSRTGGSIPLRISSIDRNIKSSGEQISDYKEYLQDYRTQLKRKYARMESSLSQLESLQENLKNFSQQ